MLRSLAGASRISCAKESCNGNPYLGKAELASKVGRENFLRSVVSHGKASSDADNMLCSCAPEGLVHFAANQLVESSVIHLVCVIWSILELIIA